MNGEVTPGETTTIVTGEPGVSAARCMVLVIGDAHLTTHPFPDGKTLVLGRDPGCEIAIVHPKISRRHVAFHAGPPLEIEDLGSTNGVFLGGRRVPAGGRAALAPGESVQVGPFTALVVGASPGGGAEAPAAAAIAVVDPTPAGIPEVAARVAMSAVSVLITGETGCGKEVLARTLHERSGRKGAFVAVNCATLGEQLLESELFGYERGAFTGAMTQKRGLFEMAAEGTMLLDEIGDLPLPLQGKLLRVLETRQLYRLGGTTPITLDARFIAATHRDLARDVTAGRFRRDLYFRVNGITFEVRPLRERREAIPALARTLLEGAAQAARVAPPPLDPAALAALRRHDWPGNVRELRTVVERALLLSNGGPIGVAHLLFDRLPGEGEGGGDDEGGARARFAAAVAAHHGNVSALARALGTSRSQVRRLAQRYGVDLERHR
jgi:DNA-binding NtrC family response regulator